MRLHPLDRIDLDRLHADAGHARRHYDTFDATVVQSTCQGYRRGGGPGGTDLPRSFSNADFAQFGSADPDCGGDFLVWWMQNMPSYGSPAKDSAGGPMLAWLPFMFY